MKYYVIFKNGTPVAKCKATLRERFRRSQELAGLRYVEVDEDAFNAHEEALSLEGDTVLVDQPKADEKKSERDKVRTEMKRYSEYPNMWAVLHSLVMGDSSELTKLKAEMVRVDKKYPLK